MEIRDRIVELRRVRAGDLLPSPHNWRTHGPDQKLAIAGSLAEVGMVDTLMARELDDGRLELINGHGRADYDEDQVWPVIILDVDEDEAKKVLATFDPITGMAGTDMVKFSELIDELDFDNADLGKLVDEILDPTVMEDVDDSAPEIIHKPEGIYEDEMELKPEEHYDYLVVLATDVNDWNRLCRLLDIPDIISNRTDRRIGMERGVHIRKILDLVDSERN